MIIVTGQTATGKTKLALELAKKHDGELVNFDSRQIYQYLDIITGKDIPKTKIWLYDVVKPNQYFSSFDFVRLADSTIKNIEDRGKTPVLVGGTYLYLKHFLYGINDNNSPPNFELRKKINDLSVVDLQRMLMKTNKETFEALNHSDQLNPRRLIRKIEIEKYKHSHPISPIKLIRPICPITQFIGLRYNDKSKLKKVIENRVEDRLKNGAVQEVRELLQMGYTKNDPGLKTIGYQQIIKFLNNEFTEKEAINDWINKEVQYAKRQLTFMKKDKLIKWRSI